MDAVERFVVEENVWRYIDRMASEPDPQVRTIISKLLLKEEDRFAREAVRLDALDAWVARLDGRLAQQKAFMDRYGTSSADLTECRRIFALFADLRMTLLSLRATAEKRVEIAANALSAQLDAKAERGALPDQ